MVSCWPFQRKKTMTKANIRFSLLTRVIYRFDVAECSLPGAGADEPDGLVDSPQGADINGLTTNGTSTTDTGRILTRTRVNDGVDQNLNGVLASHQVDDFEAVLDDADGQELLAVVAAVHHERVDQALNDGALGLAEPLGGIPSGAVWQVPLVSGDVILEGKVVATHS